MNTTPARPTCVSTVRELREAVAGARQVGGTIGLVPTMGALHEGHVSLVRASKAECDFTVVTIFVNPTQFAPSEDLAAYPRALEADLDKLAQVGADLVFTPPESEVYGPAHSTWVEPGNVARSLEGASRPDHFRGVATVVLKLLNMARPDVAFFGQKDYQQVLVVRRMVADLDVPVTIRVCPTVREPDGLAMSSRNAYLSPDARRRAAVLWKSLSAAREMVQEGNRDAKAILARMREVLLSAEGLVIDYAVLVDPESLEPVARVDAQVLAAVAARLEGTRLIDNCMIDPPSSSSPQSPIPNP
ncbi:MAG: pantoate--beta-alanine ligase [Pirellulales bacterium]|nr:pantoate--beta-alanine ligase [Pirellulales bacterium]